jgi:hypothetical protein
MRRRTACGIMLATLGLGCRAPEPVEETYKEFGEEFLPAMVELFERGGEAKQCTLVYVLWVLEARLPYEDNAARSNYNILCLSEGVTGSGNNIHRLVHVKSGYDGERITWQQAFRVGVGSEPAYHGSRNYPQRPTVLELETFLSRAKLTEDIGYYNKRLQACPTKAHHFFVRAKVYPVECKDVFGSIPECFEPILQERYADDPAPPKPPEKS